MVPLYSHTLIANDWLFGDFMCVAWSIANQSLTLASDISLVFIAHDRYQLCHDALAYWGSTSASKIKKQIGKSLLS